MILNEGRQSGGHVECRPGDSGPKHASQSQVMAGESSKAPTEFLVHPPMGLGGACRQNFKTTINLLLHIAVTSTKEDQVVAPGEAFGSPSGDGSSLSELAVMREGRSGSRGVKIKIGLPKVHGWTRNSPGGGRDACPVGET
jgi:hypothetical protein